MTVDWDGLKAVVEVVLFWCIGFPIITSVLIGLVGLIFDSIQDKKGQ